MKKVIALIILLGLSDLLQAGIPGDIDGSGCVDMRDISIFSAAWLSDNSPSANWNPACDLSDGIVDGLDLAILAEHWLLTSHFPYIPGDIDGSGRVDMTDISIFSAAWLSDNSPSANWNPACDLSDGIVDGLDLAILAENWLLTESDSSEMAFIPGGEYWMGDHFDEGWEDELPLHDVQVDSFYIGKYEVTNGQYCAFLNAAIDSNSIYVAGTFIKGTGNNKEYCRTSDNYSLPSQFLYADGVFSVLDKNGRDMTIDPVVSVTWYGAAAYCNWRSDQDGYEVCYDINDPSWPCDFTQKGYRLPTEAQWEYAARGGQDGGRFPWYEPSTISHEYANYESLHLEDEDYDVNPTTGYHPDWSGGDKPYTSPIGSFAPNGYGLYDIAGNASEWCNDWYSETYYESASLDNPTGPESGQMRLLRGGNWDYASQYSRVADRAPWFPNGFRAGSGFRICLNLN